MREKRKFLREKPDAALLWGERDTTVRIEPDLPPKMNETAVGLFQTCEGTENRGLSRARGPEQDRD